MQEKDYEQEIGKLKGDLIDETTKFKHRTDSLEESDLVLKNTYERTEEFYKDQNHQRKRKVQIVQEIKNENNYKDKNLERITEKL